jgi:O-antigen ligase
MLGLHRVLLATLLVGNAVAFAGVDPVSRMATAAIALVLAIDLRRVPVVPKVVRAAAWGFAALAIAQLLPLPMALRRVFQPGFAEVMLPGWAPLSLAPWSTVQVMASMIIAAGVALTASRMAATRSGLPTLLAILAVTCGVVAVLGIAGEGGAPESVLLIRPNTGGGDAYGPYVNSNHFAVAIELSLPAALVLLAAAARNLQRVGAARQRAAVIALAATVTATVAMAAVLRSSSRGGVLFLCAGLLLTVPLWLRPTGGRRWRSVSAFVLVLAVAMAMAWTRLPDLQENFRQLLAVEGVEGNTRWDLWAGTIKSWRRSPVVGTGLGSYRHVIGLDKPATGTRVLEQAHNDWLEWGSTSGLVGIGVLALALVGLVVPLWPKRVRRLRFELRYPLAGAAAALVATALHEMVGFGLQTPLNLYLLAAWAGLVWGATGPRSDEVRTTAQERLPGSQEDVADLLSADVENGSGRLHEPESSGGSV